MSQVLENQPVEVVADATEPNVVQEDIPPEAPQVTERSVHFTESMTSFGEEVLVEEETESEILSSSDVDEAMIALEEEHYMTENQSSDSEESSEDKFSQAAPKMKRKKLPKQPNFFDLFGRIPDIDDISLTESLKREIAIERGELIIPEPIEEAEEEGEEESEMISGETIEVESSTEFSDIDYDFESSEEEEQVAVIKKIGDEDLFEALIKAEETPVVIFEELDFEFYERLQEARQIRKDTYFFMRALIDAVVEVAEYVDPREVLRANLNKIKLFRQLVSLLEEIHAENKINEFLNNKCVMYYRRNKSLRPITPDRQNSENYDNDVRKFNEAVAELDQLLGKQSANQLVIIDHVHVVEEEFLEMEKKWKHLIHEFETLIRRTLNRRGDDSLATFIERRIKEISTLRHDISKVRRVLISHQHNKGNLLAKMAKLENITETLHLSDYERMLNEEYALEKKIEEKQERLEKTRLRFYGCTNTVAHMREKQSMLYHTIQVQKEVLAEVTMQKYNIRTYIYQLKTNRVRVKKQIRELSTQSGLIDKPALCIDFDETVDRIAGLKEKNKNMKEDIKRIENKILSLQRNSFLSEG